MISMLEFAITGCSKPSTLTAATHAYEPPSSSLGYENVMDKLVLVVVDLIVIPLGFFQLKWMPVTTSLVGMVMLHVRVYTSPWFDIPEAPVLTTGGGGGAACV